MRKLTLAFDSAEAFQREYATNLANGGAFVATDGAFSLRDRVRVCLVLKPTGGRVELDAEVVHIVTPEMVQMGGPAGVAVQFEGSVNTVRAQLEPLRSAAGAPEHRPPDAGRRRSPRTEARVAARVKAKGIDVSGHTRNLSQTGVLVAVGGKAVPVGQRVKLSLTHPNSAEVMRVEGIVVRHVENDGGVAALAVEFMPSEAQRAEVDRFVEGIQSAEHTRRLGGIAGAIEELGIPDLLQMFGAAAPAGTLILRDGEREGVIGFERGQLRFVRLGPATGMKALVRLFAWSRGRFEFNARLDPVEAPESPLSLEAALLEATRLIDEGARVDRGRYPDAAKPRLVRGADTSDATKVEAAVIDLARVGYSVRRLVDVIPEPDPEIYRAIDALCDRGVLTLRAT